MSDNYNDTSIKQDKLYKVGIFQYCDKWCEKCEHTHECLYFDVNNKFFTGEKEFTFWDKVEDIVNLTIDDLAVVSKSIGVDLTEFSKKIPKNESEETLTKGYETFEKTQEYSGLVNNWFNFFSNNPMSVSETGTNEKISPKELAESLQRLTKAVEYIRWYQNLISKKLKKALDSKYNFEDGFHKGFAKVVLVALDKSIESWKNIAVQIPNHKEKVSNQILLLERIKKEVELEFPYARAFARNGLDN